MILIAGLPPPIQLRSAALRQESGGRVAGVESSKPPANPLQATPHKPFSSRSVEMEGILEQGDRGGRNGRSWHPNERGGSAGVVHRELLRMRPGGISPMWMWGRTGERHGRGRVRSRADRVRSS